MGLTKTYSKCRKCPHRHTCDHKRLEEHRFLEPTAASSSQPLAQPLLQSHDYREIKISESATVTIDLEEIKKKLMESHFPPLLLQGGAL